MGRMKGRRHAQRDQDLRRELERQWVGDSGRYAGLGEAELIAAVGIDGMKHAEQMKQLIRGKA